MAGLVLLAGLRAKGKRSENGATNLLVFSAMLLERISNRAWAEHLLERLSVHFAWIENATGCLRSEASGGEAVPMRSRTNRQSHHSQLGQLIDNFAAHVPLHLACL